MIKVLFVCLGNICRSPLAEAIFQQKIKNRGLEQQIFVDSVGTSNYHIGDDPDPRTIHVANQHGLPIAHKGRQFTKADYNTFDYILAMDQSNRQDLTDLVGNDEKLVLMRDFDEEAPGADVPDPYFGGQDGFEHVYQMLDRSSEALLDHIVRKHGLWNE